MKRLKVGKPTNPIKSRFAWGWTECEGCTLEFRWAWMWEIVITPGTGSWSYGRFPIKNTYKHLCHECAPSYANAVCCASWFGFKSKRRPSCPPPPPCPPPKKTPVISKNIHD